MMTQLIYAANVFSFLSRISKSRSSSPRPLIVLVALMVGGVISLAITDTSVAKEPAEKFVTALAANGYFEVAIEYLDGAQKDDLVDESFREKIPFEKAKVLILSIASQRNAQQREARLNEADRLLSEYSKQLKDADKALEVVEIGANIKIKRAESNIAQSKNERLTDAEKKETLEKAQKLLDSARKQYQQARQELRTRIENFQIDPEDPNSLKAKKSLQESYVRVRTKLPLVTELIADTLNAGSPQQKKMFTEAVKENQDVYKDYRKQGAVFVFEAAINGARAAQKAGDHKTALSLLEDVFLLGEGTTANRLKKNAMLIAVDSWNQIKPYPFEDVVKLLEKPISLLNRNEVRDPSWQRLQLEFGKAQLILAESLKAKAGKENLAMARELNRESGKIIRKVARASGPYREDARSLIGQYKLSFSEQEEDTEAKPIKTFFEAKDRGSEMIAEIAELQNEISQAKRSLPSLTDAKRKAETLAMIEENSQKLDRKTEAALNLYQTALSLSNDQTPRVDINFIHYQRAICYYIQDKPLQAAVIAEFLLDKYPTVDWSKQASTYIISGFSSLLAEAPKDDRDYETNKLKSSCLEIIQRWPGSNEAATAASKMTEIAIKGNDLATAEEFFTKIPQSSPVRNQLASAVGQKLWFKYRTDKDLSEKERQAMLLKTKNLLTDAISAAGSDINYITASSALSLVDVFVEQKQFDAAIKQLETETIAPLDLVKQKHPAISDPRYADRYRRNTYLSAIKTYMGAMGTGANFDSMIDKATGVLSSLKSELESSNDPQATARLTAIYKNMAQELKSQFEELKTLEERKKFASGLATFLGTIERQSTDAPTVLWSGSTLLNTASSLAMQGAETEAAPLFKQAVSALDRAEKMGINDPNLKLALRQQRALALRGSGDFEGAVNTFIELLKEKSAVNLQIDAAETLQMWGQVKSNKDAYAKAMMGTGRYKDGKREKNAVWGWRKLVQVTRGKENLNEIYRTSLYNSIKSRLEYGVLAKNKKAIESALNELEKSLERFQFLKTGPWSKKFDDLVAAIKSNL